MQLRKFLVLASVLALVCFNVSQAEVRAQCDCQHGRSTKVFPLTVDFMSGGELTQLTNDSSFHPTAAYAIVWIGKEQNVVVKIEGQYFSNPVRENEVKKNTDTGSDLKGVGWKLTPTEFSAVMKKGKALPSYLGKEKAPVSRQPQEIGSTYPNGQIVQEVNKYFYPNGQELTDTASLFYPNGNTRIFRGRQYYPNGQLVSSQGQFFYPNGKRLTQGASASQKVQYLNDNGKKIAKGPEYIRVVDGDWTYYFDVYEGLVQINLFQAEWRSEHGTITLMVRGAEIERAGVK